MDKRAAIPVTLPRDNPTPSYWQDPPDEIADLRSSESLPENADVVIVGSGITGAAVAWNLLQNDPTRSIVMLEARQACSGATGRNGRGTLCHTNCLTSLYPLGKCRHYIALSFDTKGELIGADLIGIVTRRRTYQGGIVPLLHAQRTSTWHGDGGADCAPRAGQHPRRARLRA